MKRLMTHVTALATGFAACWVWMTQYVAPHAPAKIQVAEHVVTRTERSIDTVRKTVNRYLSEVSQPENSVETGPDPAQLALSALRDSLAAHPHDTTVAVSSTQIPLIANALAAKGDSLATCRETVGICAAGLAKIDTLKAAWATERNGYKAQLAVQRRRYWWGRIQDVGAGVLISEAAHAIAGAAKR